MQSVWEDCKLRSFWNRDYPRLPMDIGACNGRVSIRDFRNVGYLNKDLISNNVLPMIKTANRRVHSESFIENAASKQSLFPLTQ